MRRNLLIVAGMICFASLGAAVGMMASVAQDAPTVVTAPGSDTTTVTTTEAGDDTTVINTPAGEPTTVETGDNTTVVLPVGNWADAVLENAASSVAAVLMAVFGYLLRNAPRHLTDLLKTLRVEQIVGRGVDFAINATRGAVKGKTLTLSVGNQVIARALQRIIDSAPGWVIDWVGGVEAIKRMIIARLDLDVDFDVDAAPIMQAGAR